MCVAVKRVQQREHKMNGGQLSVTVLENLTEDLRDQECAVRVSNIPATLSQDFVECYFENERRSGSGNIEDVFYSQSAGVAVITFNNPQGKFLYIYTVSQKNKKAQLSLTNPRDACEKFARFTYEHWGCCKLYS